MTQPEAVAKQSPRLDWLLGGGLVVLALALYIATLAPTVLEADAGEFQFVPWLPAIAHPTGYPLYTLLGWLWSHALPLGEVAWRMNLLSAVLAAMAVGLVYAVSRQLVDLVFPHIPLAGRVIVAAVVAAVFAVTPTFWSQAVIAEVYALHTFFVAASLWLLLAWARQQCAPQAMWGKLLALTLGLSLAHHRTAVLLLPGIMLFWAWHYRFWQNSNQRFTGRLLLVYGLLFVTPLLLYLYLPLIASVTPYATLRLSDTQTLVLYENSFKGFWAHIMGRVFTAELRPTAAGLERIYLSWQFLRAEVGWVGVILAGIGLGALWRYRHFDLLLLTAVTFVTVVAFNLIYFIGDIFVLFIPAWLLVWLWSGLGLLALADQTARYLVKRKATHIPSPAFREFNQRLQNRMYQLILMIVILVGLGFWVVDLAMRNTWVDQSKNFATKTRWSEILMQPIPPKAVLLSNDRNEIMPMWYYQYVEGRRSDLMGLFPLIVTDPAYANIGRLLEQALASGRPVYLIKPMDGLNVKANMVAEGTLFKASAITSQPSHWTDLTLPEAVIQTTGSESLTETIKLLGYDIAPATARPGDELTITLYWQPVQPLSVDYTSFVHLVDEAGQGLTQSDLQPGGDYYGSHYWQVGEILRDQHTLTIPPETVAGNYYLQVGMYYQPEPGVIAGMGLGQKIGPLIITN